jgi:hypothetical protein
MRTLLISILSMLVVMACSPLWYYPHLDWLLPGYIGDYISLESGQQSDLERHVARQLEWHCRTQLPAYAAFLRSLGRDFESPDRTVSQEQIHGYYLILKRCWKDLMTSIAPDVADLLSTASNDQIDELFLNIEENNRELEGRYVDPPETEIYRNRYDRMSERLVLWIGDLDDMQQKAVWEWSYQLGTDSAQWIADRRRVQKGFRDLLSQRAVDTMFKAHFTALLTSPERLRSEPYQARVAHHTALTLDLLTRIGASLSDTQRRHFLTTLGSWAEDFDRLACPVAQTAAQDQRTALQTDYRYGGRPPLNIKRWYVRLLWKRC